MQRKPAIRGRRTLGIVVAGAFAMAGQPACKRKAFTYHDDVAPILARHCLGCHSPKGVSPNPRLSTFEQASKVQQRLKRSVQTRKMPPWGADNTGLCGTWKDARWLTDDEISTIVGWVDGGALPGDPGTSPIEPAPAQQPVLPRVDAVLDMGAPYTPGLGSGSYRCFPIDPKLGRNGMVTGIRVTSSEPAIVAQVTLFAIDDDAAWASATALDAGDAGLGYRCYGSPRVEGARLLASWAWDSPVLELPRGTGLPVHPTTRMVMQIHYDVIAAGLSASSQTRVELAVQPPGAVTEASIVALHPSDFVLGGGERYVETTAELAITRPMTVHGVAPRMHTLGETMQLDLLGGGAERCVANFNHWMFYRQQLFGYQQPVRVGPGDRLRIRCTYTTLNREAVRMGEDISEEECVAYLYVTP